MYVQTDVIGSPKRISWGICPLPFAQKEKRKEEEVRKEEEKR
jgi:hypothetical protein